MTLRDKHSHIPATSKPLFCRKETEGKKCGKPANHSLTLKVTIYDKKINAKIPVCEDHFTEVATHGTD